MKRRKRLARALRMIRGLPLVVATVKDDPINGGDAVEELCEIRRIIDKALKGKRR